MEKNRLYGSKYHREQLNIAWEAIRRSSEYKKDFESYDTACNEAHVGELSHIKDLPQEIRTKLHRFRDKWGVDPFPPQLSFNEIELRLKQLFTKAKKEKPSVRILEGLKDEKEWRSLKGEKVFSRGPNIPKEFGVMYNRLRGFKRGKEIVVRCREREEEMAKLRELCGLSESDKLPQPKKWIPRLIEGGWLPPKRIHLTINLDAGSEEAILEKVKNEVRYYQRLRKKLGLSLPQPRYHLDIYLDCFKVRDMFKDKTADQIAPLLWPSEWEKHGGRDTITGEKGALIQRAYAYRDRAKDIIKEMVDRIREKGIKI